MGRVCDCENEGPETFLYLGTDIKREVEFPDGDYNVHYYYCYNCGKEFMVGGKTGINFPFDRDSYCVKDITRWGLDGISFGSLKEKNIRELIALIMEAKKKEAYFNDAYLRSTINEFVLQRKL